MRHSHAGRLCLVLCLLALVGTFAGCKRTPVPNFTADKVEGMAPLTVQFTDQSTIAKANKLVKWEWDFGDGGTSTDQNPSHTYAAAGVYKVRLVVTHDNGRAAEMVKPDYITVAPATVAVPDVAGQAQAAAGAAITGAGLTVGAVTQQCSDTVAAGLVISQDPAAGAAVAPGSAVALVVSTGPCGADKTTLMGYVTLPGGAALPLVAVKVGALETFTDSTGHYVFGNLEPAAGMVVSFSKTGFTANAVTADGIAGGITTANATLKPLADPVPLDAAAGGAITDGLSNTIIFGENAFVTKSGRKSVAGVVDVSITPLDVTDEDDLSAFPGNFLAIPAAKADGTVQLETFALADYTVTQDGEALDLAPGGSATIELALPGNTPLADGEQVPLWSFDEATGLWVEEGVGQIVPSSRKAGTLVYRATITHLSWWNCDAPLSDKNCVTGTVVDETGAPVAGAPVEAVGTTYNGVTSGVTGADGRFCVDVKRGSTVTVRVYLPGGRVVVRETVVSLPDAEASCATGGCTDAGTLQLSFDSCISGRVLGEDGAPVANAQVRASTGNTAVADANGDYCMPAPANIPVSVYVLGRPPVVVTTPPAASCGTGGCAVADIVVDYPEEGDLVGAVTAGVVNQFGGTPVKATVTMLSGSASFFAWNTGANAPGPVTSDNCEVSVGTLQDGEWQIEGMEDVFGNVGALDPGAPGEMSANSAATPMVRLSDVMAGEPGQEGGQDLTPFLFGVFTSENGLSGSPGDTAAFSWPGGMDIGPFTASVQTPSQVVLLLPEPQDMYPDYPGMAYYVDIDPAQDLPVQWDGSASDGIVLSLTSGVWDEVAMVYTFGSVVCTLVDDGEHTVPAALLSQLPVNPYSGIALSIVRMKQTQAQVPLARGGNGWVILRGETSYVAAGKPNWVTPPAK